jgi:rubrerythrin
MDVKSDPGQLDVYRLAMEKEKQSVDLYKKLLSESEGDKALFKFLIAQEEAHYKIMELIVKLVSRPNEWVESAEFGIREESDKRIRVYNLSG